MLFRSSPRLRRLRRRRRRILLQVQFRHGRVTVSLPAFISIDRSSCSPLFVSAFSLISLAFLSLPPAPSPPTILPVQRQLPGEQLV